MAHFSDDETVAKMEHPKWATQPTRRGRWRPGDRRPGAGIAPVRCGAPGAGLWSVAAPRRSVLRLPQCRSRQMQAFRSRDLNGLVTWQTAYHPEGVGIDCYGLMRVPEEK